MVQHTLAPFVISHRSNTENLSIGKEADIEDRSSILC